VAGLTSSNRRVTICPVEIDLMVLAYLGE